MDFELNNDQELIQKTFRDFVANEVTPHAESIDKIKCFPWHCLKSGGFGILWNALS